MEGEREGEDVSGGWEGGREGGREGDSPTYVDDSGGVLGCGGCFKEGQGQAGEAEEGRQVQSHDLVEGLRGKENKNELVAI